MPEPPKNGHGKSASTCPPSSLGMTTRSQSKTLQSSPNPTQQGPPNPSSYAPAASPAGSPPASVAPTATPKPKPLRTSTALSWIIFLLDQILAKYNPPGQIKQALTEVLEVVLRLGFIFVSHALSLIKFSRYVYYRPVSLCLPDYFGLCHYLNI